LEFFGSQFEFRSKTPISAPAEMRHNYYRCRYGNEGKDAMGGVGRWSVTRGFFKGILLQFILVVVSLVVTEGVPRVIDLRYLRIVVPKNEVASIFQFDSELGWSPTPNAISTFPCNLRTITVQNNSLGLRDIEPGHTSKPTVLFIGDSFVWGYNVESDERFTEFLRKKCPAIRSSTPECRALALIKNTRCFGVCGRI
jgi:hypothetical protein